MSCNCTGSLVDCIKTYVGPCDLGINTGLVAEQTGNHLVMLMFNGVSTQFLLAVAEGQTIVLPNTINNNAVFDMQVYHPDDTLLNDTCYQLRTIVTLSNANAQITPSPEGSDKKFITVTQDGTILTDAFFGLHYISEIDTDNQAYLRNVGFTQNGATITALSFGFYAGQVILAKA